MPTCGDWPAAGDAPGDAAPTVTLLVTVGDPLTGTETFPETAPGDCSVTGDAPGDKGPTVTFPVTVGDAPGDAGPTEALPETAPGGGAGEPACGGGCRHEQHIIYSKTQSYSKMKHMVCQ